MSKKIKRIAKLQFIGGQAKPGAELASIGIVIPKFCTQFNEATKDRQGEVVPVIITAYEDKSFTFVLKTTPVTNLILKKLNAKKGSGKPNLEKIGKITLKDVREIAEYKLNDLNTNDIEQAIKIVTGTAKSLGVEIESEIDKE